MQNSTCYDIHCHTYACMPHYFHLEFFYRLISFVLE